MGVWFFNTYPLPKWQAHSIGLFVLGATYYLLSGGI